MSLPVPIEQRVGMCVVIRLGYDSKITTPHASASNDEF